MWSWSPCAIAVVRHLPQRAEIILRKRADTHLTGNGRPTIPPYPQVVAVFGFGISTPAQVKAAVASGAAGVISGSRVVSIIEEHLSDHSLLLREIAHFVGAMKDATR